VENTVVGAIHRGGVWGPAAQACYRILVVAWGHTRIGANDKTKDSLLQGFSDRNRLENGSSLLRRLLTTVGISSNHSAKLPEMLSRARLAEGGLGLPIARYSNGRAVSDNGDEVNTDDSNSKRWDSGQL
jgi:hypothetical protein